jgi:hypothetical protein
LTGVGVGVILLHPTHTHPLPSLIMGHTSTHLENLSMATSRWVKPPGAFRKGPTMSSPHMSKGHVTGMVCRTCACRLDLRA